MPRAQNPKNLIQVPLVKSSHNAPGIRFATWNARSIKAKHKSTALCDFVINNQLDLLTVTETWLTGTDKDNRAIADIKNTLPNYQLYHIHRQQKQGGGLAVLLRDGLSARLNSISKCRSFEYMDLMVSSASSSFQLVVICRPRPTKENKLSAGIFFEDFPTLL